MKRGVIWLVLVVFNTLALQAQSITLGECLEAATAHHPTAEQMQLQGKLGEELRKALWLAYVPQLSLEASANYLSDVVELDIKMPEVMGIKVPPPDLPKIPHFQYNTYLQVTQLIWDGGRVKAGTEAIKSETAAQLTETEVRAKKVHDAVVELYFALLLVDKQMELQKVVIEELDRQADKVTSLLATGMASENDLDLVTVEQIKAKQTSDQLQQSRKALLETLSIYTGLKLSEGAVAQLPSLPALPTEKGSRVAPNRAEHLLLDSRLRSLSADWKAYLAKGMPNLALFARGGYGRPGLNMMNPDPSFYYIAGAKLSWNFGKLYDLSTQKKKLHQSQRLVELERASLEKEFQRELSEAYNEVERYETQITSDKLLVETLERVLNRTKKSEEEGTLATSEYLEQKSKLDAAKRTLEVDQLQLLRAKYRVQNRLGL